MGLRKLSVVGTFVVLALVPVTSAVASDIVVVSPNNMHGWVFFEDNNGGPGTGHMVTGPADPPLGSGSAELAVATPTVAVPVDRQALGTPGYQGTMIRDITSLNYWTYQTSPTHAITLQFDVRYHPSDTGYQGRLVFEPGGVSNPGIVANAWQQWDGLTGKWWASRNGPTASNGLCTQATPCTWSQVKANWPNASLLSNGALLFKVGGGWEPWKGNLDAFTIGVQGRESTTYDFEPTCQESDGGGNFQGQQQGNFSFDGDGCADGDHNNVQSSNRGDGKAFSSTRLDSIQTDNAAHAITISGVGVSAGLRVSFVFVAVESSPTTPGWVSFAFSDGYANAGPLLSGGILVH